MQMAKKLTLGFQAKTLEEY